MPLRRRPEPPKAAVEPTADPLLALRTGTPDERRLAAVSAAGRQGGVEALGEALATETDARVRTAIFTSLVRLGNAASVAMVIPYLSSDDAALRSGALDALRAMPAAAGPALPRLLHDPDPDVRLLSCEIARNLASAEAAALLRDLLLRDEAVNVCAAAVDVLAEIDGPQAAPALLRCAERFPDEPFVAFSVRMALRRLGAAPGNTRE